MRKLTVTNCTVAAAMLLLIGCETDRREADTSADSAAIRTVIEHVAEAWKAGDWNTLAGFYTDDTIWMPPGEASLRGKDAVRAWVEPIWSKYSVVEISMPSEEIVVIGDWAYERHREMLEIYEVGGIPTKYYLKGVRILRRGEDGSWKIARYIWNGDIRPD